jgi:NADH:ubiquinone oxidoreductase subunit 2 (subunit N)
VRTGLPLRVAIIVCLVAVLALGVWPSPLVGEAAQATSAFLAGH